MSEMKYSKFGGGGEMFGDYSAFCEFHSSRIRPNWFESSLSSLRCRRVTCHMRYLFVVSNPPTFSAAEAVCAILSQEPSAGLSKSHR